MRAAKGRRLARLVAGVAAIDRPLLIGQAGAVGALPLTPENRANQPQGLTELPSTSGIKGRLHDSFVEFRLPNAESVRLRPNQPRH